VDEVHVNVHHLANTILEYYGSRTSVNGTTVCITRENKLLGTAGGVKRIADRFDETFVIVMGDALTDVDVQEVVAFHKERGALATLALMRVADTSQYGVVDLDSEHNIVGFHEKSDPSEAISNLANTGVYVLEPDMLKHIPEDTFFDFAEDVFPRLLEAGEKFVGYEGNFYWSDIGTLKAYRVAQHDALSEGPVANPRRAAVGGSLGRSRRLDPPHGHPRRAGGAQAGRCHRKGSYLNRGYHGGKRL